MFLVYLKLLVFDFSKTFDKVSHPKRLAKLSAYGIRNALLSCLNCYFLNCRTQNVKINKYTFEVKPFTIDFMKGSRLVPPLLTIYVDDIFEGFAHVCRHACLPMTNKLSTYLKETFNLTSRLKSMVTSLISQILLRWYNSSNLWTHARTYKLVLICR